MQVTFMQPGLSSFADDYREQ